MRKLIITILIALFALGCSGGNGTPSSPDTVLNETERAAGQHAIWGLWQGIIDTQAEMIEFVPLRIAELHLNALPFLEPPLYLYLSVEHLQFNGDEIEVDIGLRHPFLGLNQFTGFDVCGIFITNGSVTGFSDPAIMMPGEGETRLLNPDGYSRWWNPTEFPVNPGTIKGYTDGLLGNPYSVAEFNCTLNGYKYFCDDLAEITDTLDAVTLENRGMFNAGQKNVRCYIIKLGAGGLVFNYAVDACWKFPTGGAPWEIPGDFPPKANREEAWRISVNEIENTLYNDGVDNGGDLSLSIDVYDWFNADMNSVRVESPGNFTMIETATAVGGGEGYSTYEIDITGATPGEESIDILISVISGQEDFGGFITGTNTTAYLVHIADVSGEQPYLPADPVVGNVWLEVLRNAQKTTITGLQVSWIDNDEPYFAVYADDDPYDAIETWDFVTEVDTTTAQIDITNMTDFSGSGGYFFTVRARSVSGLASTESANSQWCFVEMEDFDDGDNPNEWTIGYKDNSVKWTIVPAGQVDGSSSLRIDTHPFGYWSVIISEPLPAIADSELSFIEFAHLTTTHYHYSAYTSYTIGHSPSPAPQGGVSTYNDFDFPNDWYVIMDDTHGWIMPSGPPPNGWLTPLGTYFGMPNMGEWKGFGWRLHDGPHDTPDMSRVRHDYYISEAPNVRAGMGYGTTTWNNLYDWGEFDEIAVVIY